MKEPFRKAGIEGPSSLLRLVLKIGCLPFLAAVLFSCSGIRDLPDGEGNSRDDSSVSEGSKQSGTANERVRRAAKFYQEQRFDETVVELEGALKALPELPANLDRREQLLSMLRLAKAKVLLSRYRERIKEVEADAIRRKQIAEYTITQSYGTVWESFEGKQVKTVIGESVTKEAIYFVRKESGLEITSEDGTMIRSVDSSSFSFSGAGAIDLNEGALLLHLPKSSTPFRVNGPLAGLTVHSKKASTALFSVTTSGGLKIISNERDMLIGSIAEDLEVKLQPGELVFALPDPQGLSRKMNVELSTILLTSNLLNGFEDPVPFSRSLRLAAMIQARRIKGRFRAVVGDVKSGDNFEVKVIEDKDKEEKEEDDQDAKPE